jgi:PQQ-dependent dehydrogenase (methanol/ethanol family)
MDAARVRSTGLMPMKNLAVLFATICVFGSVAFDQVIAQDRSHEDFGHAKAVFEANCAACHGSGGAGGDRAPTLVGNAPLRALGESQIANIIHNGTDHGMPSFASLPTRDIADIARWLHAENPSAASTGSSNEVKTGEAFFFGKGGCSTCHMVRGRGGVNGPDLSSVATRSSTDDIARMLNDPSVWLSLRSLPICPSWAFCPDTQWNVVTVRLANGTPIRGFAHRETEHGLQLQTFDGKMLLLRSAEYQVISRETKPYMPALKAGAEERRALLAYLYSLNGVPAGPLAASAALVATGEIQKIAEPAVGEWPNYNGSPRGNRYSDLDQIDTKNVSRLRAQWVFAPGGEGLEATPVVADGVMYVTGAARVCALDARNGDQIWCVPRTSGQETQAPAQHAKPNRPTPGTPVGPNRGVAVLGDRVFYTTDDAYLVCLNRLTGALMWSVLLPEPDAPGKYGTSAAPMIVDDLVVSGVSGGDSPLRGFIAAYDAMTGQQIWRFHTIPKVGEPTAATWKGRAMPTGGGATWATGSYDAETDTLYWAVGNPYPDTDADERGGTNLYTNCVVALDAKTGKLRWYFQFTPHDVHDWDAQQPFLLVDARFHGRERKLLLSAQRSGFFYVLDRTSGEFLLGKSFIQNMTWASGVDAKGVPTLLPGNTPTPDGIKTCPAVRGATNWYSTAFDPKTRLFYVMAAEDCGIYRKIGKVFDNDPDPSALGKRFVRALDIETGAVVWQKELVGPQETNYTGVLATAGGLVFHGETGGDFAAVDAATGKTLWTFPANDSWRASPMTYMADGRQYVAGIAGTNVLTFALDDAR